MKPRRFQFRLRTLLLIMPMFCAVLVLGVSEYQRHREYRDAWFELAVLKMGSTIGPGVRLHSQRVAWSDDDVNKLVRIIKVLGRRQNFGFLRGVTIAVIDFKGSQISDESLARIRKTTPTTTVRR